MASLTLIRRNHRAEKEQMQGDQCRQSGAAVTPQALVKPLCEPAPYIFTTVFTRLIFYARSQNCGKQL
jgi:hypothetical protein